jgi:hypothetical protein
MKKVKVVLRDAATDCDVEVNGTPLEVAAVAVAETAETVALTFELSRDVVEVVDERSGAE